MNDRELLEAAAKAAGMMDGTRQLSRSLDGTLWAGTGMAVRPWNPLTDDGDAFRLAVHLQMRVTVDADFTGAGWDKHQKAPTTDGRGPWGWKEWHYSMSGPNVGQGRDPYAATRRAIVRAAASIGGTNDDQ